MELSKSKNPLIQLSAHSVEWGVSCQTEQADIKRYSEELQQRLGHTNAPDAENYAPDSAGTTSPILVLSDSEPDPAPILERSDSQAPIIDLSVSPPFDERPSTSAGPSVRRILREFLVNLADFRRRAEPWPRSILWITPTTLEKR